MRCLVQELRVGILLPYLLRQCSRSSKGGIIAPLSRWENEQSIQHANIFKSLLQKKITKWNNFFLLVYIELFWVSFPYREFCMCISKLSLSIWIYLIFLCIYIHIYKLWPIIHTTRSFSSDPLLILKRFLFYSQIAAQLSNIMNIFVAVVFFHLSQAWLTFR